MIEDKLTQEQRIRLECLAQANATSLGETAEEVLAKAAKFAEYVKGPAMRRAHTSQITIHKLPES